MASGPKYILSAGLGRFAALDPNARAHFGPDAGAKTKEMLASSISKARAAGFEVIGEDVNPQDPEDTIKRFVDQLQSRKWVGLNVGYGVRGHKEHTALFEKLLNTAWEVQPGIKIMFSNGPDEVITAIQRSFPETFR